MTQTILAVDDNANTRQLLTDYLSEREFKVITANDGRDALAALAQNMPDLILLDVMMPTMDGYQFIGRVRRNSNVPVIMVTAKRHEEDVIRGFELGADDYIIKPYRMRELLMRIRAVLRRSKEQDSTQVNTVGDFRFNSQTRQVTICDQPVDLTAAEYLILETLAESANPKNRLQHEPVHRAKLSTVLIQHNFSGADNTLKIHIRNLRHKIEPNPANPIYIETVFGIGYRLKSGSQT